MIELLGDLYRFILSGVSIGFVVAAFFILYFINKKMKEREAFDEKYRKSKDLKDKEWKR